MQIFGKEKCKSHHQFQRYLGDVTSVSLSLSLSLSLYLSLSPSAPHAQYRKRFRASYNYYLNVTILFLLFVYYTRCVLENNASETHGRAMERTIVVRAWLLQCFLSAAAAGSARPTMALLHSHKPVHISHASLFDLLAYTGIFGKLELFLCGVRCRTHISFLGTGQEESASISQTRQGMLSFYAVTMVMIKLPLRELRKRRQVDGME